MMMLKVNEGTHQVCHSTPACIYNLKDCVGGGSLHLDLHCQDAKQDNLNCGSCCIPAHIDTPPRMI